jgi:transcription elongation factor Elf1
MDEADLIDWYDVVEAAANGQLANSACPKCGKRRLATSQQGSWMRIRCGDCGEGFEGRMNGARDDAFMAEADALMRRTERPAAVASSAASPTSPATPAATPQPGVTRYDPPAAAPAGRGEPWSWQLPAESGNDLDGLSLWMDTVQAVHNGRRTGLSCPFCSEPLSEITARDPFVRIRCGQCGEGFEGRIG